MVEGFGIIVSKSNGETVLSFRSHLDKDIDIKVIEGKVTWYREGTIFGIEEAQKIADQAIAFSVLWKGIKEKKL